MPGVAEEWINTTERIGPNAFALYVRGDSMEPEFSEGDIILVDPAEEAASGDFVVVRLDDEAEATFKQLIIDGSRRYLKPLNPRYPIMEVTTSATICGVVLTSTKHHKRKRRHYY